LVLPPPKQRETDLCGRFFSFAIGALAFASRISHVVSRIVNVLLYIVGCIVHASLSAANPFPTGGDGSVERILRAANYLIAGVFAGLWRKQNPQSGSNTDADNERRSGFLPTQLSHKPSIYIVFCKLKYG
jgi:hypothetical protein